MNNATLAEPAAIGIVPATRYRAFGLDIASDVELPELVEAQGAQADVEIRLVNTGRTFPSPEAEAEFRFGDDECFLLYPQIGAFRVLPPGLIEVEPVPGVDPALLCFPLLGPVIALLLQARGAFLLHGSALNVGGRAVCFLGDKGAGKSTTAGAFLRAGHSLLTDDIVAIEGLEEGGGSILPAFPQVKLTREASMSLALPEVRERPKVPIVLYKERFLLGRGFAQDRLPPGLFLLLRRSDHLGIQWLDPKERMKAFLRFSYGTRFGMRGITPATAACHARQCPALAHRARAAILSVPHDLGRLSEVVALVEAELSRSDPAP
ncbi:serine kinase [Erythrobacter sp. NFXS35]|uniref:serine kinase n=1 Tax=Erythrobacter sp. NFXS35 TaxID=2818436 RepID=UPI0032DF03F3